MFDIKIIYGGGVGGLVQSGKSAGLRPSQAQRLRSRLHQPDFPSSALIRSARSGRHDERREDLKMLRVRLSSVALFITNPRRLFTAPTFEGNIREEFTTGESRRCVKAIKEMMKR